jgi:hypothetical protein
MDGERNESSSRMSNTDLEAIRHLKEAVGRGVAWHVALLEAIGLWVRPDEDIAASHYDYLIDGEAFDWILLAERLTREIPGVIPKDELEALLFHGSFPVAVSDEEFRRYIGEAKYHAYLNYFYGVTVEKFILLAVEEEIAKEQHGFVFSRRGGGQDDSYMRVYGATEAQLVDRFAAEKGYDVAGGMSAAQLKEFTYWLFKYRLRNSDKARVASDTKKGVEYLRRQRAATGLDVPTEESSHIIDHRR